MHYKKILLESIRIVGYGTIALLLRAHAKWLSPLADRLDIEVQQLLEPHQWYQGVKALTLTILILVFAFCFLLWIFHRNRSKEYVEMKQRERAEREEREMQQRLLMAGVEFDIRGTLTRDETGERFCPHCYARYRELNCLEKMTSPKKIGWRICKKCGRKYM